MDVSVVIRNRNEAEHLRVVLAALALQHQPHEVVLVDNRSTDGSVELAEEHGATVVQIDDFTYGRALNLGFEATTGECCVVLSAHSVPQTPWFLTACADVLTDPTVGGARCIYAGKGADQTRWVDPVRLGPGDDVISLGPLGSGCVIRRSAWQRIRFDETAEAAEDKWWAQQALEAGWVIVSPIPAVYAYVKSKTERERSAIRRREHAAVRSLFRRR